MKFVEIIHLKITGKLYRIFLNFVGQIPLSRQIKKIYFPVAGLRNANSICSFTYKHSF